MSLQTLKKCHYKLQCYAHILSPNGFYFQRLLMLWVTWDIFHPSYTGIIQATTKNRNLHVFYILDVQYTAILSKQNSEELTNPSFYYNEDYANEFQCKRQSNTSKSKKHWPMSRWEEKLKHWKWSHFLQLNRAHIIVHFSRKLQQNITKDAQNLKALLNNFVQFSPQL